MQFFIYAKLSFEKDFNRIEIINDNLFSQNKISIEDLENYLQFKVYMTPVQILNVSALDNQFIYNYSQVILQLKERYVEKILNFIFENNSYELILRQPKNQSTLKVKFLLNLIRKQLNIDSRIYISTLNQKMFQLDDSVSISDIIYVSLQPYSPHKTPIAQKDTQNISFDQISLTSTQDQSENDAKERLSTELFLDQILDPSMLNPKQQNNLLNTENNFSQQKSCPNINLYHCNQSSLQNQRNLFPISYNSQSKPQITYCPSFFNKRFEIPKPSKLLNQPITMSNPFLKKPSYFYSNSVKNSSQSSQIDSQTGIKQKTCLPIQKQIRKQK